MAQLRDELGWSDADVGTVFEAEGVHSGRVTQEQVRWSGLAACGAALFDVSCLGWL